MEYNSDFGTQQKTEEITQVVSTYFKIYGMDATEEYVVYYIDFPSDMTTFGEKFERIRDELYQKGCIPFLRTKNGENVILVSPKPIIKQKSIKVPLLLFVATVITTILSGSMLFAESFNVSEIFAAKNLLFGLVFFSAPLLAILGIHEMGHYFASKKHKLASSLPLFIPIPPNPMFPLGTMGALISMKEPIPNKKALLEIGAAGPICGFLVAIPITIGGLLMSSTVTLSEIPVGTPSLGESPLFLFLKDLMLRVPEGSTVMLHPTAFAGWVGLLVTAINLLPAGQLDGGHIMRALLGDKHKYASWGVLALMLGLGLIYPSWIFLAFIIIFLLGSTHPPPLDDISPLDIRGKAIAFLALVIFILSFTPIPIQ